MRLREVLTGQPATELELRTLSEQTDAWARTLQGQIEGSERRLRELADSGSLLAEIAAELRRIERLRRELAELRSHLGELDTRARELRSARLLAQTGVRGEQ